MSQIKQLLFDCDNTLVLTEDVAFEACARLVNELLTEYNISDRYTNEELIIKFMGLSFKGMMVALQQKYHFKMSPEKVSFYTKREEELVIIQFNNGVHPTAGSMQILEILSQTTKYGLAIASSSALRRIHASIQKTGQDKFFNPDHVFSAATSLAKPAPKPSPEVYLHAMKVLNVKPEECITVEDSKSGALSAVRAGIPCIAYVGAYHTRHKQEQIARLLLDLGCKVVMYHWSEFFDCLGKIEEMLALESVKV